MSRSFVVDASATLKLLIEEPGSAGARLFFGRLSDPAPPSLYVPDLLYIECANIVWKYVWRHGYATQAAHASLKALADLSLQTVPTQQLFREAFHLSTRHKISAYDACYLALAQRFRCPLITEDSKLIRQVSIRTSIPLLSLVEALSEA